MTEKALTTTQTGELSAASQALPLDQHPVAVYLAGLSSGSRRTMRASLATIAGILTNTQERRGKKWIYRDDPFALDWSSLRFQHTSAVRAKLGELYSPATANKMLSALRGTLKAAWQLGQMGADDYRLATSVESLKGETLPAGRDITSGELAALMGACQADQSLSGVRDAAIIGLLYTCGLRRAELVALDLDDYDREAGTLAVRRKDGRVGPKGSKERLVYPSSGAIVALADWLALRGDEPGPLFYPIRKGGHLQKRRMTAQAVWKRLKYRAQQAGVDDLSPHDFRRTFVGDLLDAGADLVTVSKMAGHSNVQTTARYDRRGEKAKRKAAGLLHLPYRRQVLRDE